VSRQPASPESDRPDPDGPHRATVIIVVARGEESLYRYTGATFDLEPEVEVIRDRRYGERRRQASVPPLERRRGDRRLPQRIDVLKAQGWLIIRARGDAASR